MRSDIKATQNACQKKNSQGVKFIKMRCKFTCKMGKRLPSVPYAVVMVVPAEMAYNVRYRATVLAFSQKMLGQWWKREICQSGWFMAQTLAS